MRKQPLVTNSQNIDPPSNYSEARMLHAKERQIGSFQSPPSLPKINLVFGQNDELTAQSQAEELIQEFLAKKCLFNTLSEFRKEINIKQNLTESLDFKEVLLAAFEQNNSKIFFEYWTKFIPIGRRIRELKTVKLEIFLRIYFLTFKFCGGRSSTKERSEQKSNKFRIIRRSGDKSSLDSGLREQGPTSKATAIMVIEGLRSILEPNGEQLAKIDDLMAFYGLLYIKDPQLHPLFKNIFTKEWRESVSISLVNYLDSLFSSNSEPRILELTMQNIISVQKTTSLNQIHNSKDHYNSQNSDQYSESEENNLIQKEELFFMKHATPMESGTHELMTNNSIPEQHSIPNSTLNSNKNPSGLDDILNICKDLFNNEGTDRGKILQALAKKASVLANEQSHSGQIIKNNTKTNVSPLCLLLLGYLNRKLQAY